MLTRDLLTTILKNEDFKSVTCLKLENLQLSSCFKLLLQEFGLHLYLLSLKNNSIVEIDIKLGFSNLHKLDLSTNFLSNIGKRELWESMPRLQILYLHDNLLETWSTLESLSGLPAILHLTLFNNPCIHLPGYRRFMINGLDSLKALDFYICTEEEKKNLTSFDVEKSKIWIQDTSDIRNFKQHIYKLQRKWEKCSPVIRIQAFWRGFKVRKHVGGHFTERDKKAVIIQKHVRGWLMRKKWKRDLEQLLKDTNNEYLLYSPEDFIHFKAVKKIENWYRVYKGRKEVRERRNRAATRIQSAFKKYKSSRLQVPLMSHLKFFVLKSQQRTLICLIRALSVFHPEQYHPAAHIKDRVCPEFFEHLPVRTEGFPFAQLFDCISECKSIKVIRFPDTDNIPYTDLPLSQMVKWVPLAKLSPSCIEKPLTNVQISSKYCTPSQHLVLKKFKNRGSSVSREMLETAKKAKYKLDDYLDFLQFTGPSPEFMTELFELILKFNRFLNQRDLPLFIPVYEVFVNRVKAACTVQAAWRGIKLRKESDLPLRAIRRRAAVSIQRWWRMIKFNIRLTALTLLRSLLSSFQIPTLYFQEHFFQYLSPSRSKLTFIEQDFSFYCDQDSVYLLTNPKPSHKLLPSWLGTQLFLDRSGRSVPDESKSLQALILSGARVEVVTLASQVSESKVADPSLRFLKLEYSSLTEARRRVAVLFLKTWNFRHKSAVPVFTIQDLKQQFLMSKLRLAWSLRNINSNEACPAVGILIKALSVVETVKEVTPLPPPATAPVQGPRRSERLFEVESESEQLPPRKTISSQEHLRKRVQKIREDSSRRLNESKISKQLELEAKINECREAKEHLNEVFEFRQIFEHRQTELKKSLIEAQARKKQVLNNERRFIVQFSQAKNMLQKLMKNSDMNRWKNKSREDVRARVQDFKNKSRERKELFESMLYEKYKHNKTSAL
jgi:hypothetical protein